MRHTLLLFALLISTVSACKSRPEAPVETAATNASVKASGASESAPNEENLRFGQAIEPGPTSADGLAVATFAGGCFWCMEPPFDEVEGVVSTTSGYTGGPETAPSYEQVASGRTGHTESVLVLYDPGVVTYEELLGVFWRSHDPTDASGQFADRGAQYRPAIFYHSPEQEQAAIASRDALAASAKFEKPIAVEIVAAETFWPAEAYHQDFYKKKPTHYKRYRRGSGRDAFLDEHWGTP